MKTIKKYIIVNKNGTPFNTFYSFYIKKDVFSNKCYTIFGTFAEATDYLEKIKKELRNELNFHISLASNKSPDFFEYVKKSANKEYNYWIKRFDTCKIKEI